MQVQGGAQGPQLPLPPRMRVQAQQVQVRRLQRQGPQRQRILFVVRL